jgi:hypothetical protein
MTTETTQELTVLLDLTQTEKDLQLAEQKHMNVVYDVAVPKQMQLAKQARKELKSMRTTVEGKRLEAGRVLLSMKQKNDEMAKGLIARIAAMEDPIDGAIKAEEARVEAEKQAQILANNARIEAHREAIKRMREFPMSLQGKPADVMKIKQDQWIESLAGNLDDKAWDVFEEFEDEARDAYKGALYTSNELIARAVEQEKRDRIAAENERKLREMEERNAQLEREAEARREADAKREREEREAAERKELERVAELERVQREARELEAAEERARERAIREAEEAEQRARDEAERTRLAEQAEAQRQEQARLDQQRREHESQVERDRIAKLGLMDAVKAVVEHFRDHTSCPQCIFDLTLVYDALPAEKHIPAKPTRAKVK